MSVIHPGSSINFDVANLRHNDEDENEMLQEELRQQKELRELLSAELSEELTDDDQSSVNDSHRSLPQDVNNEHQEAVDSPIITSNTGWMQGVNGGTYNNVAQQSMTPASGDQLHSDQYYGRYNYDTTNQYNFPNGQQQYYDPSYGIATSQSQPWQQPDYGNDVMFSQQRNIGVGQYMQYNQNGVTPHQLIDETGEYPFAERGEVEGSEDYGDAVDGNMMQHQQQFIHYKPERNIHPTSKNSFTSSPGSKLSYRQSYPPNHGKSKHPGSYSRYDSNHDVSVESSPADYESHDRDKLQQQFTNIANENRDENSRQMAQLQILYKARGKKIDELTRELDEMKGENAREKRILNHQLAMAKDQKDGMGTSLEESQRLVQEKERDIEGLKGKVDAQAAENESLKSNKNELLTKIQVSERTIESLHEQLTQMSHSESIERAREQHDAVLNAATQRHEMQVLELTTQLDGCRQEISEKNDEVEKLRFHLNKISRESEQTLLDKTETINRLTKSLEESQNQCQGLLAGSNETTFARHQVTDLMQERKQNEEEIALLKMQARDAEEHLKLYEKALQLGAGPGRHHTRGGSLSDSLSELMNNDVARKLDWKTPQIKTPVFESGSQEELLDGLRKELQRALNCNKSKRDEVTKLKRQCIELEKESSHWRSRADEAQTQLKLNISMPPEKPHEEKENALRTEDLEERVRNAESETKKLDKTCTEVKQRMAEMIQEHDQDKQDAVERCERALMQLHDDAKQALRDELISEHEQKLYELSVEHDAKMRELNSELDELQHELYDVKQSYVHVCAEKDQIQATTRDELAQQHEKEKEDLISEHETAIKKLENMLDHLETDMKEKIKEEKEKCGLEWENEREKIIASLKNEWEQEKESDFTQRMETQIALAKVNWFEEFTNSKQKAIHAAVKQEEEKWTERIEELRASWNEQAMSVRENHLKEEKQKWMEEKNEEISRLQEDFQSEKESAVKMATCMAELNKTLYKENAEEEMRQLLELKLKEAKDEWKKEQDDLLQNTRESWRKEHDDVMKEAKESWMQEHERLINEAVTDVRQEMEKELEREEKTHKSVMEKAVQEVKKICDQEKQDVLKQKTADMEKEIKKLQDQHRKDYELFVEEHKRTLATFLENEKTRSTPIPVCRDASTQAENKIADQKDNAQDKQKLWDSEKELLLKKNREEIADLQRNYEQRFSEQKNEIQHLVKEKNDISAKLQQTESKLQIQGERAALDIEKEKSRLQIENEQLRNEISSVDSKIAKVKEQNKDDMNRLKERMREEYRRWKKERSSLISKLKEQAASPSYRPETATSSTGSSSSCRSCRTAQENHSELLKHKDEATKKAISELTDIYSATLKMIKDEMMSYIGESRGRTRETISQDRKRTANKLKAHYTKAMQKFKPVTENQTKLLERLKLFESDSDSRPETPAISEAKTTTQPMINLPSEKEFQSRNRPHSTKTNDRPKTLQKERFLDQYEEENHFPTKLLPEGGHSQKSSAFSQLPKTRDLFSRNFQSGDIPRFGQSFVPSDGVYTSRPQYNRSQGEHGYTIEKRNSDSRYHDPQMRSYQNQLPSSVDFSPRRVPGGAVSKNFSEFLLSRDTPDNASLGGTYRPPRSTNR